MTETLRVAPLFETLDDLHNSEASMESLLSNKWYCDQIGGRQECMIGYSDSGKDAGRLAAAWGLYEVQVMQALKPLGFKTFGLANILDLLALSLLERHAARFSRRSMGRLLTEDFHASVGR